MTIGNWTKPVPLSPRSSWAARGTCRRNSTRARRSSQRCLTWDFCSVRH